MNNKIRNVLLKLEEKGFEAYVIGGFVRDYILGIESYDVDIATSASPKDIKEIFDLSSSTEENYGSVYFKDKLYNYDITTYRKELKYSNRKPVEYEFAKTIEEDIERRDFTINAIYMDKDGKIIDPLKGKEDIYEGIIKCIGDIKTKMEEDPLRMLRAIRFAASLNFKIEPELYNFIKDNKELINTLSYTRKKEELEEIFKNQNKLKGINLIRSLELSDVLEIEIPENIYISDNVYGIWAQINYSDNYNFSNNEEEKIKQIKKIINYGIIDNIVLYEYGLHNCIIAGEVLNIPRTSISDIYKNMPIYSVKDIVTNGNDIIDILNIEEGNKIGEIQLDLVINILNGTIENTYESIKEYLNKNWR